MIDPSKWHLCKTLADWDAYRQAYATSVGLASEVIAWGKGPQIYPCLVCSYLVTATSHVIGCYVYPDDVKALVGAMNLPAASPVQPQAEPDVPPPSPPDPVTKQEFEKSVSAHLLTIVKFLEDIGIIKDQSVYEACYNRFLADVDQVHADDLQRLSTDLVLRREGVPPAEPEQEPE